MSTNFALSIRTFTKSDTKLSLEIKGDKQYGLDKSYINGLRRALLTNIQTPRLDSIRIVNNDTPLFNEFIEERLFLIPIYIDPQSYNNDYLFHLNVTNKENRIMKITCQNFKIYPLKESVKNQPEQIRKLSKENYDFNKPLSEKETLEIFRPFQFQGTTYHMPIAELKASDSDVEAPNLELYCIPRVSTGKEHASFNNVSKSVYTFKIDDSLVKETLSERMNVEEITKQKRDFKKNFLLSESERYYKRDISQEPYWYTFDIISNHYHTPAVLFQQAVLYLIDLVTNSKEQIDLLATDTSSLYTIIPHKKNSLCIVMNQENDTLGNIIQSYISNHSITESSLITFCGYKDPHPLENKIHLIIAYKSSEKSQQQIKISVLNQLSEIYDEILEELEIILREANKITN
jgi:DNA-directed RNA polymerase subunit L